MKKNLQGLVAIPAVLLFLTSVVPLIYAALMSVKDYSPFAGLFGSPTAPDGGLYYYLSFLRSPFFSRLFINSFLHGFIPILAASLLSFGFVYCLLNIKNRIIRYSLLGLIALTAFTPVLIYTSGVITLVTVEGPLSSIVFAVLNALPMVFVASLLGVVVCERLGSSVKNMLYTVGFVAILWAVTILSFNTEAILAAYIPQNYMYMDTFRTYVFRASIAEGNFPLSTATDMIVNLFQVFLAAGAFFAIGAIVKRLFKPAAPEAFIEKPASTEKSVIGICVGSFIALLTLIPVLTAVLGSLIADMENGTLFNNISYGTDFGSGLFHSILLMLLSMIIFVPMTLILAYSLHGGNKITRGLLLFLMACSTTMGQYLTMKSFGLLDTAVGLALFGSVSLFGVFILYLWVEAKAKGAILGFGQYCIQALVPLLVVTVIHLATTYGSYFWQMICIRSEDKLGFSVMLYKYFQILKIGMPVNIPSVVIIAIMVIPVILAVCTVIAVYFDGWKKPVKNTAPTYYVPPVQ